MKNNKGFSLVELIIVIAIMAILVGVMAPQLIKYIEKTNVSADTQLCDTVKGAVITAVMDPAVINATTPGIPNDNAPTAVKDCGDASKAFNAAIQETLGMSSADIALIDNKVKSKHNGDITFEIKGANSVHVWIPNSDASGKKNTTYGTDATKIIYVD